MRLYGDHQQNTVKVAVVFWKKKQQKNSDYNYSTMIT